MNLAILQGIGILGPGMENWANASQILRAEMPYQAKPYAQPRPILLPPAERRRAPLGARMAISVADQAVREAERDATELAAVFASSEGEIEISHQLCQALAKPDPWVSPTQFHNSVHNVAAGYWSIATSSHTSATSLSCYDCTVASSLLQAMVYLQVEKQAVLLVVHDSQVPKPLFSCRPIDTGLAVALVLAPKDSNVEQGILLRLCGAQDGAPVSTMADPALEVLRQAHPVARILPLLRAIANRTGSVVLEYLSGQKLQLEVGGC